MALPASLSNQSDATRQLVASSASAGTSNAFGATYFVDASNGDDTLTGLSPQDAKITIAAAITAAQAGDTIILSPETHSVDVSAAALVPKADMTFIGTNKPYGGLPATAITADVDDGVDLITVDVDGVIFDGIRLLLISGGSSALRLASVGQTTAVNGLTFRDCWFDLNSVDASGVIALAVNDATNDTIGMLVRGCRFTGATATTNTSILVDVGAGGITKALFEDNIFELQTIDADSIAFNFADPAGTGSYGFVIRNNDFIGPIDGGGDAVPFVINSNMTEDEFVAMIRTNYFSNVTTAPITVDKVNNSMVWNYAGADSSGGTIVNPGT